MWVESLLLYPVPHKLYIERTTERQSGFYWNWFTAENNSCLQKDMFIFHYN